MEDYLEAVFQLLKEKQVVRVKDIARRLDVRMPSVTAALEVLKRHQLVRHERYGHVQLTEAGRRLAEGIDHRHQTLVQFLTEILEVPPEAAETEACQMEHAVSERTLDRLLRLLAFMENCPRAGADWLRRLSRQWQGEGCDGQCETCLEEYLARLKERVEEEKGEQRTTVTTLNELSPGQKGAVHKVGGKGAVRRRLIDMGLVPGSEIEVERVAPLGDPIEVKVKGYHLSLRKEEAAQIQVEVDCNGPACVPFGFVVSR